MLIDDCNSLKLSLDIKFINNPLYASTNYIYSIYCAKDLLDDDILLMHGDIVFDYNALQDTLAQDRSVMKVSSTIPLPEKDFKAVVDSNLRISKIGIEFFDSAL